MEWFLAIIQAVSAIAAAASAVYAARAARAARDAVDHARDEARAARREREHREREAMYDGALAILQEIAISSGTVAILPAGRLGAFILAHDLMEELPTCREVVEAVTGITGPTPELIIRATEEVNGRKASIRRALARES